MKKFLPYIFIIMVVAGFSFPVAMLRAEEQGTCITDKNKYINVTKAACDLVAKNTGEKVVSWTSNTPQTPTSDTSKYNLLAPLPCTGDAASGCINGELKTFDASGEGGGALGSYLNLMLKLFIGICAVLAVVMIVIGGIEYMTSELVSSKEHGKEKIKGALFGLLLALGAYTLLNTINPALLNSDFKTLEDVAIEVDANDRVPQTYDPTTKKYSNGTVYGSKWDDSIGRIEPLPDYVTLNNKQCTFIGEKNCTSTRSLDTTKLREIQWGCGCSLVITGATEFWLHGGKTGSTTHQLTSTTVDLRPSPELNRYLSGGKPLVKMRRYPEPGGPYLYEGDHWHIGR